MWLRSGFVSPLPIIFEIDMDDLAWTKELLVHYQHTSWHCLCEMVFDDVGGTSSWVHSTSPATSLTLCGDHSAHAAQVVNVFSNNSCYFPSPLP